MLFEGIEIDAFGGYTATRFVSSRYLVYSGRHLACIECPRRQIEELLLHHMPFPTAGVELTHILVVSDLARARDFYRDVLGAAIYREYGGTSCVLQFQGTWLLLVTGGGPTPDKPDTTFAPPADPSRVAHAMTIRVPDCRDAYDELRSRGAVFVTPPHDWGHELRCFFRDPDGHLLEISESR